jgi:uncharacterized protein (DUF1778 family)
MATSRTKRGPRRPHSTLMVRLDAASKESLSAAAQLRGISLSDYVRTVTVAQAQREVQAARGQTISLTPAEQLAFWKALQETPRLSPAQRKLAALMRARP